MFVMQWTPSVCVFFHLFFKEPLLFFGLPPDVQQQHLCEDEDEWHLHKQELHTILDQAESEPPQIKEEPEELCSDQEREQLLLNQGADVKVEFKSDLLDHQHQPRNIIMIPIIKLERIGM